MGQVLIPSTPDETLVGVKQREEPSGQSPERFLRDILERNRRPNAEELLALSDRIRAQTAHGPALSAEERREGLA